MSGIYMFLIWIIVPLVFAAFVYYRTGIRMQREEEERITEILAHKSEWGEDMCQWLIEHRIRTDDPLVTDIMDHFEEWGKEKCQLQIQKLDPLPI